ncbi:MAG: hypothetical protein WAN86_22480 [Hyphomicrobiaceae bacterium]
MAAGKAGLAATVTLEHERPVLEFHETRAGVALPGVIAGFDDDPEGEAGRADRLTLSVETARNGRRS